MADSARDIKIEEKTRTMFAVVRTGGKASAGEPASAPPTDSATGLSEKRRAREAPTSGAAGAANHGAKHLRAGCAASGPRQGTRSAPILDAAPILVMSLSVQPKRMLNVECEHAQFYH